jgi:hypothetical protein
MKKGRVGKSVSFGGFPYSVNGKTDVYDIAKVIAKEERKYHHEHIQERAFSNRAKHTSTFNTVKEVLAENPPIPAKPVKKAAVREDIHDGKSFKPANPGKRGKNGTLDKFPKHVPEMPKPKIYVKPPDDAPESPPGFKCTYK